jgi:hypothetical protein
MRLTARHHLHDNTIAFVAVIRASCGDVTTSKLHILNDGKKITNVASQLNHSSDTYCFTGSGSAELHPETQHHAVEAEFELGWAVGFLFT